MHANPEYINGAANFPENTSYEWEDWVASQEIPFRTPLTPLTPRLEGVTMGKSVNRYLCTPKGHKNGLKTRHVSQAPESKASRNFASLRHDEQFCDPQFQVIRGLLAEQKRELNRIATEYGERLIFWCQENYATGLTFQIPKQISTMGAALDSSAQATACSMDEKAESNGSCALANQKYKMQNDDELSGNSVIETRTCDDFKLLKGWLKVEDFKDDSTSTMSVGMHVMQISSTTQLSAGSRIKSQYQEHLTRIVSHKAFDFLSVAVILFHAVLMGFHADDCARHEGKTDQKLYRSIDFAFLMVYSLELLLRIGADGWEFIYNGWTVFDLLLLTCDGIGQAYELISSDDSQSALGNVTLARSFRAFRLLRAFRVLRLVHFFRELRMMVKCMTASTKTALWVLLLLFLDIYIFSVYLIERVAEGRTQSGIDNKDMLKLRFGTLADALFTLFMAISGGVSWVEFADPLIEIHWTNGVVVVIFIFCTVLTMLNIITGVFVDCALTAARSDEEEVLQDIIHEEKYNFSKIRQLFELSKQGQGGDLSLAELEAQIMNVDGRRLFKSIGIGVHEVHGLFRLLDMDNSGTVSLDEFITGCMRLREGASSIDMCTLMYENKRMMEKIRTMNAETKKQFQSLYDLISRLAHL